MKKPRGCPDCGTILVCWNWCRSDSNFPPYAPAWMHECWECDNLFETGYEVTDGVPYKALKPLRTLQEQGKPVVYSQQMRVLYGED